MIGEHLPSDVRRVYRDDDFWLNTDHLETVHSEVDFAYMTIALIANPSAGGKKGTRIIPRVEALLRQHGIDYRLFVTQYHEHALTIAGKLPPHRFDGIVSMGGDGTNFHVLNGLLKNYDPATLAAFGHHSRGQRQLLCPGPRTSVPPKMASGHW